MFLILFVVDLSVKKAVSDFARVGVYLCPTAYSDTSAYFQCYFLKCGHCLDHGVTSGRGGSRQSFCLCWVWIVIWKSEGEATRFVSLYLGYERFSLIVKHTAVLWWCVTGMGCWHFLGRGAANPFTAWLSRGCALLLLVRLMRQRQLTVVLDELKCCYIYCHGASMDLCKIEQE